TEAADLAVSAQPLLQALEARVSAAQETAVAARQFPDPQLKFGVTNLPANTADRFSLSRDFMTMTGIGLMQEFPHAEKRRLRGDLSEREAARLDAERQLASRSIRRDASLAWLELWRYDRLQALVRTNLREADAQQQVVEIALKTGTATQGDFLAARQEVDRLRDEVAGAEQGVAQARSVLSRWIGEAAQRPVCPELPNALPLPSLAVTQMQVRSHPLVASAMAQLAAAQTDADLAQAAYKPDWRAELGFAYRPDFSEMLSFQVGVDLPVFTRNRQDRGLAAAFAQRDAAAFTVEDARRQLMSEARLNHHNYERLVVRLGDHDQILLPQSQNRIAAALAGWRSGRNVLREVLDARRAALEIEMARLDLQFDLAKHVVQLTYLGAYEAATGENSHE
ncbi:MAG TPA: hypothetical protein DDW98_15385, partial [Gammaproteobacteria bacterium]|nr:hypothetical protein [Gammaproteobacteria bacterium]